MSTETIDTNSLDKPIKTKKKQVKSKSVKKSTKKVAKKKATKRRTAPKKKESGSGLAWAVPLVVLILVVIIAGILLTRPGSDSGIDSNRQVAALINGEPIYQDDVDRQLELLPAPVQASITREALLLQMIDEVILLQAADERSIIVSEEEIDEDIEELLVANGITILELNANLQDRGLTNEDFRILLAKQAKISKLVDESVLNDLEITETEKRAYYESNLAAYETQEQVTVRHILINQENNEELSQQIIDQYEGGEDFCTLVEEHSEDLGSVDNCGEYTFGRGVMVPPFEETSFDLSIGGLDVAQSTFGLHIIEKLDTLPAGTRSFEDVEEDITQVLESEQRRVRFDAFLAELRENSEIENYLLNPPSEVEVTGNTVQEIEMDTPEEEIEMDPVQEIEIKEPPEVVQIELSDETELAICLSEQGAILYGTQWSGDTEDQLALFGEGKDLLIYKDCTVEGSRRPRQECIELNIPFPTWIIDDTKHFGVKSLDELRDISGCTIKE